MRGRLLIAGLAGLALACSAGQQGDEESQPAPTAAEVLNHTFNTTGEFTRVFLASGSTYEAELDGGGIRLQVRPIDNSIPQPRVRERLSGTSAGGSSVFTIEPQADAEYEFRVIAGNPGRPLNLRVKLLPKRDGN
jgi:hypothetical protein